MSIIKNSEEEAERSLKNIKAPQVKDRHDIKSISYARHGFPPIFVVKSCIMSSPTVYKFVHVRIQLSICRYIVKGLSRDMFLMHVKVKGI